jgi:hypothetical protein
VIRRDRGHDLLHSDEMVANALLLMAGHRSQLRAARVQVEVTITQDMGAI